MTADDSTGAPGPWDDVARQLQEWRRADDEPSYSEIALRISRRREDEGTDPVAARVGRTTVYDAFRLGRARVNRELVREIAVALGVEGSAVRDLLERPREIIAPAVEPVNEAPKSTGTSHGVRSSIALMTGCLVMNLLGREFVDLLGVPLYLDMVGTALAAVVLGPWRGAGVGAATNVLGYLTTGWVSVPFAIVNVAGALIWGYGVHRFDLGRTLARFFLLTMGVAIACTLIAVPIMWWVFDGIAGQNQAPVTTNIEMLTQSFATALWGGNLLTSVADKMISAFTALVGASLLGHSIAGLAPSPPAVSRPRRRRDARTA